MENQNNQESNSSKDQADGKFDGNIQNAGTVKRGPLAKGISDDDEQSGSVYSENLMSDADMQVRETEDSSLQDDTYAFDEDNTDNDDYHDVDDLGDADLTDIFDSNEDGLQ